MFYATVGNLQIIFNNGDFHVYFTDKAVPFRVIRERMCDFTGHIDGFVAKCLKRVVVAFSFIGRLYLAKQAAFSRQGYPLGAVSN